MYKCEECEMIIEEERDLAEEFDGTSICPYCSGDVMKVEECDCGGYMEWGEELCEECKIDVLKRFHDFLDTLTEVEREYLNQEYDGEWF